MDDADIKSLKKAIQETYKFNDQEMNEWWHQKQAAFGGKSPAEMCKDPDSYRKLQIFITSYRKLCHLIWVSINY